MLKPTRAEDSIARLYASYLLSSQAITALVPHMRMVFAHVHAASDVHISQVQDADRGLPFLPGGSRRPCKHIHLFLPAKTKGRDPRHVACPVIVGAGVAAGSSGDGGKKQGCGGGRHGGWFVVARGQYYCLA